MKKLLLLAALMLPGWLCFAQRDTTLTIQQVYDRTFANLNPADITTGVLIDRTQPMSDLVLFNGSSGGVCNRKAFEQLYLEFYNASLNRGLLGSPDTHSVLCFLAKHALLQAS